MSNLRVLIVDDEPLIRQGIRNGLSTCEGIEITGECDSGLRAIDTILSERPDLVLRNDFLGDLGPIVLNRALRRPGLGGLGG